VLAEMPARQTYWCDVCFSAPVSALSFFSPASRGATLYCVYQTMSPPTQGVIVVKPVTFFASMFPLFADSIVDI